MLSSPDTETSNFVKHEPCPSCGSRNNLARYDDGHGFCFGCSYWEPGEHNIVQPQKQRMSFPIKGLPEPLPKRGRSEEHTSELSHTVISYAVFCLKKKKQNKNKQKT